MRAQSLGKKLKRLVEFTHKTGLEFHIQTYELLLDQWIAKQIVSADFSKSRLNDYIHNRLSELFEHTGVDGLIITLTEAHSRGNCYYVDWSKYYASPGDFANSLYEIIKGLGKQMRFRLWLTVTNESQWQQFKIEIPGDLILSPKNTSADFWLGSGLHPVIKNTDQPRRLCSQYL